MAEEVTFDSDQYPSVPDIRRKMGGRAQGVRPHNRLDRRGYENKSNPTDKVLK